MCSTPADGLQKDNTDPTTSTTILCHLGPFSSLVANSLVSLF